MTIPIPAVVDIYAAEGMLYVSQRDLADALRRVIDGKEIPEDWETIDRCREEVIRYSKQYTLAIRNLQRNQEKA